MFSSQSLAPEAFTLLRPADTSVGEFGCVAPNSALVYCLPEHLRACELRDGAIFLDLKRNRYFAVGQREVEALRMLCMNWPQPKARTGLAIDDPLSTHETHVIAIELVERGLLSPPQTDAPHTCGALDPAGAHTAIDQLGVEPAPLTTIDVARFMQACMWARRAAQGRSLHEVARELSAAKSRRDPGASLNIRKAAQLTGKFRRLRPWAFSAKNQCLFHALALTRFLMLHDEYAVWIIGVKTRPWSAHSWVQHASVALDATPESLCDYTPILVV